MSTETKTVKLELHYHGSDEVITCHNTTMTRNEMRALMVWLATRTNAKSLSENCAVATTRLYYLLKAANTDITELEDAVRGPLENP